MEAKDLSILVLGFLIVQALIGWWTQARITHSIKHEYDLKLEDFKRDQLRKEKAAVVSELLAEWTHLQGTDTKRLNQLLWELTLYLPSELVCDVNSLVRGSPNGKTAPELLVAVRNHLLNGSDPIQESEVAHFAHPMNTSMQSSSKP